MGRDFEVNRVGSKGGSRLSSHQKLENQSHGSKSGPTEKEEGVEYMVEDWKLTWRRSLFDAEVEMADNFLGEISQQQVDSSREDTWIWKPETCGYYSTKSGYNLIWGETMGASLNSDFQDLWKLKIPAKAAVFA